MEILRPINSFKNYFLDIKPYHTKILEVIEKYLFQEDLKIQINEKIFFNIQFKNDPLCRPVGYGFIWDGECGFDAIDCCDLFDCIGGYGLVFDNSDLTIEYPINFIDSSVDTVSVPGNQTYDIRGQIDSIPTNNIVEIIGNFTNFFSFQKIFLIVPVKTLNVISNTENTLIINGNYAEILANEKKFRLYNTNDDDGIYTVLNSTYDENENQTIITLLPSQTISSNLTYGIIEFKTGSRNNGAYVVDEVNFDGNVTTILLNESTPIAFTNTTEGSNHGSIQLRTGMLSGRFIELQETGTTGDGSYQIIKSEYVPNAGETIIHLIANIPEDSNMGFVRMYGYIQGEGFDGYGDCGTPKHSHVKVGVYENVLIEVSKPIGSFTPTPTMTQTPTMTPGGTPGETVTPTPTITPTPTPSG